MGNNLGAANPPDPPRDLVSQISLSSSSSLTRSSGNNGFLGGLKLIYDLSCGRQRQGQWVLARYDQCPIAFEDPSFRLHESLCNENLRIASWSSLYGRHQVMPMFTWQGPMAWGGNTMSFCQNVPVCLSCPVLGQCPRQTPNQPSRCSCSGFVGWNSMLRQEQGECLTRDPNSRRYYCYVDRNSGCMDVEQSNTFPGRFWSYNACDSRRPRGDEDDMGFADDGWMGDVSGFDG